MGTWARSVIPTVLLVFSGQHELCAQQRPAGTYASAQDWLQGIPDMEFMPTIRKVRHFTEGFDLFKFNYANGNQIGSDHWGLVRNDTLYIWYSGSRFIKAEEQGRVCYFKGPPYVTEGQRMAIRDNYFWFGNLAGAMTATDIYAQVKDRIHYVLEIQTGRLHPLGVGRMRIILADNPALLAAFERETQPPSVEVMLDYLRKLNAGIE